jgi:co-chaperonin GroES (HSP10)
VNVSGTRITHGPGATVPGHMQIRPLRDQIIVEPLKTVLSKTIVVVEDTLPLRGIVKAVGPGCYPKVYDHPEKHKRSRMWDSEVFEPTTVKVGDVVELGGYDYRGYSFPQVIWGGKLHLICREADVSGVVDGLTAEQARQESEELAA